MKIIFIGGGNMAGALVGGLLTQGFPVSDIRIVEPQPERRRVLSTDFGVSCFANSPSSPLDSDVFVLAIKPQQVAEALAPLSGRLADPLVISIAAGIRLADISRWLGGHEKLVRAMPNTPALIGNGMSGLYAAPSVDIGARKQAETILCAVGKTLWISDEAMMDAVTAISGSGPAYVFYFIEALQEAGQALGFSETDSHTMALETMRGAVALALHGNESIATLRKRVTSPGGTTEAALNSFATDRFKDIVLRAARAAKARGREMGDQAGRH